MNTKTVENESEKFLEQSVLRPPFYRHPLVMLHTSIWIIYIIGDSFDHIKSGYYDLIPSIFCGASAFALTGLVALASNRLDDKNIKVQGVVFITLLFTAIIIWHKIFSIMHRLTDTSIVEEIDKLIQAQFSDWFQTGYMPLFLFIAWGGVFVASKWYLAHRDQQMLLNRALLDSKKSQLQSLRYQLNPHFLFNVLNSIDVCVLNEDKDTAHNMLKYLSGFLRSSLQQGEQSKISLKQELEIVDDFIRIEQLRFGDALKVETNIEPELLSAMVPPMLLQPLVENAIKFAWSQTEQGKILLAVSHRESRLIISIVNSKSQNVQDKAGTGTGLSNIAERLALLYGEDAKMRISDETYEFSVKLSIPLELAI